MSAFLVCCLVQAAQPPDFSRGALRTSAETAGSAWDAWEKSGVRLETDIGTLPVREAQSRIQTASAALTAYLEARRAYSESVASMIDAPGSGLAGRIEISEAAVSGDQLDLLGATLMKLQSSLDDLRASANWTKIRRTVQADRAQLTAAEESLRNHIPVQGVFEQTKPPALYSATEYRESERRVREIVKTLWSHYYDSLASSLSVPEQAPASEKKPGKGSRKHFWQTKGSDEPEGHSSLNRDMPKKGLALDVGTDYSYGTGWSR